MTISHAQFAEPAEQDIAWQHYSAKAMVPSFLVCGALSIALLTGGWFFEDIRGIGQTYGSLIFFQLTVAVWLVQAWRWLYRGSTYAYRLTNKHLLIDRGFLYDRDEPIKLADIAEVEWGCDPLGFFLAVGWVRVTTAEKRLVTMKGVIRPAAFAELIDKRRKSL